MTHEQENKLRAELTGKAKKKHSGVPEEQQSFLNSIHEQLSEYLKGEDTEPFEIPGNVFQRRHIYQTFITEFPEAHIKTVTQNKKIKCMVTRTNSEEQQELVLEKQKIEVDDQVGFTKVISVLTSSGKLIVDHNMLLDVFHTIHNFHGALPANLEDFKKTSRLSPKASFQGCWTPS